MSDIVSIAYNDEALIRKQEAASIFSLKAEKHGGLYNSKKVAGIAEGAGIPCYVGCMVETGIGTAAYAHLAASTKNVTYGSELFGPLAIKEDIIVDPIKYEKGYIFVPKGPGLGVEVDEDKLNKYLVK